MRAYNNELLLFDQQKLTSTFPSLTGTQRFCSECAGYRVPLSSLYTDMLWLSVIYLIKIDTLVLHV